MRFKYFLSLAIICLLFSSCMSLALKMIGAYDKEAAVKIYSNNDRTMAYISMKHVGPKEFYDNVKHKVDSLQKEGFIVYMEGISLTGTLSEQQKDTLNRKIRKMVGVPITKKGYIDTLNSTIMGRKFNNNHHLINQPSYAKLGVDTIMGRRQDIAKDLLIKEYERQFGKLILTDCDYTTPLEEKYTCDKAPATNSNAIILDYRNEYLAKAIMADKHKKIVVLYGARHETGLYKKLHEADTLWQLKNKAVKQ